jgi:phage repressor protein C with HTH and peptisase S24 domain
MDWLLTGRDRRVRQAEAQGQASRGNGRTRALYDKISELLSRDPHALAGLNAFVDLLSRRLTGQAVEPGNGADDSGRAAQVRPGRGVQSPGRGRLPILGRTAAGVIHFWQGEQPLPRVTELADLIARHERSAHGERIGSDVSGESPMMAPLQLDSDRVSLVQLSQPDETGVAEFVQCREICERYPDAFALRIDGDSMAPRIADGDVVVLSPSVAARDHWPAVVQLHGQIGVTCKLFQRAGRRVQLIAVNEKYAARICRPDELAWALAVLWRLRFR